MDNNHAEKEMRNPAVIRSLHGDYFVYIIFIVEIVFTYFISNHTAIIEVRKSN
jgi:hypothetical protein